MRSCRSPTSRGRLERVPPDARRRRGRARRRAGVARLAAAPDRGPPGGAGVPVEPTFEPCPRAGRRRHLSGDGHYLSDPGLRREINDGLQVAEHWNSANTVIFYGKDGELTGADREDQETSMLTLHLLQSALVHLNTLLVQRVLDDPAWVERLTDDDRRGLTPLFWSNINPYGTFHLDMTKRLDLERTAQATTVR